MRKFLCALLALALLLGLGAALAEAENLLTNGDFSGGDGDLPDGWRRDMWQTDAGVSILTVDDDGFEGRCVTVTNVDANDARFAQTVKVEPDSVYRLSGMVRAEGCDADGYGATLSIADVFVYSDGVYDTDGDWLYVELYGRTGESQTELTVFARVGGYGSLEEGRASFDDIALEAVDEAPGGAIVYDFFREDSGSASSGFSTADAGQPARNTETWLLFICCWALVVVGVSRKRGRGAEPMKKNLRLALFILGLALACVLRLILAARVRGYYTDINCFSAWSERMFEVGPLKFYDADYFCDYPPGYMLLLGLVAALRRVLGFAPGSGAYVALLKLIPILADIASGVVVWHVARKKGSETGAMLLGLLVAFNPAAIANSAAWGQIDGLLALLIALCALEAGEGRYVRSLMWYGAALLVKPQALLFGPIGLMVILCTIFSADPKERGKKLRGLLVGAAACLGLIYTVALICCANQATGLFDALVRPFGWMFTLYTGTMSGYRYITVNTLNLHYLLGMNWARVEEHAVVNVLAWVLFVLSYLFCLFLCLKSAKRPRRICLIGALLIVLVCAFGPMIHERYLFPGLILLALAFAEERDKRLLISLVALSATLFLNEILVLQGGMTEANYGHLQESERWLNCLVSLLNVLNAGFLAWTAAHICLKDRVWQLREPKREAACAGAHSLAEKPDYRMSLKRPDFLLMAAVTALYSVLAFTNLGTLRAPQTDWTASQGGEAVVFDLGAVEDFRLTYYGGICNSTFTVEFSNDGEHWSEPDEATYNQGEIFRWLWYVPSARAGDFSSDAGNDAAHPMVAARYARLTAQSAGLVLYEVGFLDESGAPLPIAHVSQTGALEGSDSRAENLVDEQAAVAAHPSYLNSTYFDEIYHARTAYEHLHGLTAYEWTHPPLGKVLMMVGIQLFGMTPFGWRFMGALVGVLMVPLMYLLVKQLTKDTRLSFIAMCLMALDSMHFTQTRIATIDSYAVFWIMLMYLFMFCYCQMSWNREPLWRTLVPLGLCGVTMGIAWATKWVGLYASAGLAILFFWTVFRRLRELGHQLDKAASVRSLCITLAFCVVFFIAIPLLIYYFSYFWLLRPEGVKTFGDMFSRARLTRVIELQKSIFNYHAGLGGDTHYFRSPWYQWPVIWWPMWYYSGTEYMPDGTISSISCMGNPAVWWFGLVALIFIVLRMCWQRRAHRRDVMAVIGFASQFLPWVIVPRSTFIYHYFASVPFIIIASVLLLDAIRHESETAFNITSGALLGTALVLFGAFYPLESGLPCSRAYARHLRWFRWYNY